MWTLFRIKLWLTSLFHRKDEITPQLSISRNAVGTRFNVSGYLRFDEPKYKHDCDHCTFLGHYNRADLYWCGGKYPTIIARYSSDGPDYVSGFPSASVNHELAEALNRARDRGLRVDHPCWN